MSKRSAKLLAASGATRPHGTRARYVSGCRCRRCRKANRVLWNERRRMIKEFAKTLDVPKRWRLVLVGKDGSRVKVTMLPHCRMPRGEGTICGKRLGPRWVIPLCSSCQEKVGWNGLVPVRKAKAYLKKLSAAGIGYKTAADAAQVATSVLSQILSGEKKTIRQKTLDAILAVPLTLKTDASLVDAKPTKVLIQELVSKAELPPFRLAKMLGTKANGLQILRSPQVTAKTALRVEKLHRKVFEELESDPGHPKRKMSQMINAILKEGVSRRDLAKHLGWHNLDFDTYKGFARTKVYLELKSAYEYFTGDFKTEMDGVKICTTCGHDHSPAARKKFVRSQLPATFTELRGLRSCVYKGEGGYRMLFRDLQDVGAVQARGTKHAGGDWFFPEKGKSASGVGISSEQDNNASLPQEDADPATSTTNQEDRDGSGDFGEGQELPRTDRDGPEDGRARPAAHDDERGGGDPGELLDEARADPEDGEDAGASGRAPAGAEAGAGLLG